MVLQQVFVIFLLIVIGAFVKRLKVVTDDVIREVGGLVLNVTLPAFLITSMNMEFSPSVLKSSAMFLVISLSVYVFGILMVKPATWLLKVDGKAMDVYEYIILFSNFGYMGYPVINLIYGSQGVFYAAIYNLPFSFLVWTHGVHVLKRHTDSASVHSKKFHVNASLVAIVTGFILFLMSVELPAPIFDALTLVGSMTTPLSMMFIGFILADSDFKQLTMDWKVYAFSLLRLLIMPICVYFVLMTMGFEGLLLGVPVVISAMPAAANSAVIAAQYGSDYQLASRAIFISTLLSIATIPLFVALLAA
ncbi:AEC family transporter [Acidaminobacter sp.]|uniref:AEC family transporter n=1 Tax=Acidaminobacter sp. TaxID=1872102 RepID=UPI001380771A|nr:AEC family transporter [Acidaminobacter sp.]MDK9712265.1 AEC family transporter [Acidaminobacter sp.]MZQ96435.1 AEC family transporter [Acidaminobacter sp.]